MKKYYLVFILILMTLFGCNAVQNLKQSMQEKIKISMDWLKINDMGKYEQGYDETANYCKKNIDKDQWITKMKIFREPLGSAINRKFAGISYYTRPTGQYLTIRYSTKFEKMQATETINMIKEKGKWKVCAYYIV